MVQVAFLVLLAALLFVSAWAVIARPRIVYGILAIAEIGLFTALALDFHQRSIDAKRQLAMFEDYAVDTTTSGDHVIRIREIQGAAGLQVRPIPRGHAKPPTREELEACEWRIEGYPIRPPEGPGEGAIHQFYSEEWGRGSFKQFKLMYRVTDQSRPTLERIAVLRAQLPYYQAKDTYAAVGVCRMLMTWCIVLGVIGLVGLASQSIRWALRKRHGHEGGGP